MFCKNQVCNLHIKSGIGFVVAIIKHRIFPGHAFQFLCIINSFYVFEYPFHQTLKHVQYILLLHKTHFAIYLCKLRLPVGTKIFITKTFYNLIVPVVTTYHQQLFKCLWRLWQRIKLSCIHPARHYKIPGAFGCAFNEERRFNIHEIIFV